MQFISTKQDSTINIGYKMARLLRPGDIICMIGDLGSGKTTFVKGVAKGLKVNPDNIHSPTFVLMNIYEGKLPLYHFDLYRLDQVDEMTGLGFDEFLYAKGISMIEWADRMGPFTPDEYLEIDLAHKGDQKRLLKFKAHGARYRQLVKEISESIK